MISLYLQQTLFDRDHLEKALAFKVGSSIAP